MPAVTKEFFDSLPEKDILMIRDYIWTRFGTGPAVRETVPPLDAPQTNTSEDWIFSNRGVSSE